MSETEMDPRDEFESLMARLQGQCQEDFVSKLRDILKSALLSCPWRLQQYLLENAQNARDLVECCFDTTTPGGRIQARGYELMLKEQVQRHCAENDALRPNQGPVSMVAASPQPSTNRNTSVGRATTTNALRECESPGEGREKRLKVTAKIEHAYQLAGLPPELVASAEHLKGTLNAEQPTLRELDTRPWVRQVMEWLVSQGIINMTDNAGVLKKVCMACNPHLYLHPYTYTYPYP
jgi:hypothetical protein